MSPKRGQPPKPPEEKRSKYTVYLSPVEKAEVEDARDKESPAKRTGAYIREAAVKHAEEVNRKK